MADERSSGFFFDVQKWKGSKSVQRMSFAEQGVYLAMMCEQWEKRHLPDDQEGVADAIAVTDGQRREAINAFPVVRTKFAVDERKPGWIYNLSLERVRRRQRANKQKRVDAGRRGGEASARKRLQEKAEQPQQPLSIRQRSSTDKTRQDKTQTRQDLIRQEHRDGFVRFWAVYPKHVGEQEALRFWAGLNPSDALILKIVNATKAYAQYVLDWKPKFIKDPIRWLEGAHWDDELGSAPKHDTWICQHQPTCADAWAHGRLVDAEASGDLELVASVRRLNAKAVRA